MSARKVTQSVYTDTTNSNCLKSVVVSIINSTFAAPVFFLELTNEFQPAIQKKICRKSSWSGK